MEKLKQFILNEALEFSASKDTELLTQVNVKNALFISFGNLIIHLKLSRATSILNTPSAPNFPNLVIYEIFYDELYAIRNRVITLILKDSLMTSEGEQLFLKNLFELYYSNNNKIPQK